MAVEVYRVMFVNQVAVNVNRLIDDSAAATQPLSHSARVAGAATQPLCQSGWSSHSATQSLCQSFHISHSARVAEWLMWKFPPLRVQSNKMLPIFPVSHHLLICGRRDRSPYDLCGGFVSPSCTVCSANSFWSQTSSNFGHLRRLGAGRAPNLWTVRHSHDRKQCPHTHTFNIIQRIKHIKDIKHHQNASHTSSLSCSKVKVFLTSEL